MRHWKTKMRLHAVLDTPCGLVYELTVSGWNPHRRAHLPADLFPSEMLGDIEHSPGPDECTMYIDASVDLDATRAADLDPQPPFSLARVRFTEMQIDDTGLVTDLGVHELDKVEYSA